MTYFDDQEVRNKSQVSSNGAPKQSESVLELTSEASGSVSNKEKLDTVYTIHSSKVENILLLEKYQIEEELIATEKEEKRLKELIKQETEEHTSQLMGELALGPNNTLSCVQMFSRKIEFLCKEHQKALDHLANLRLVHSNYLDVTQEELQPLDYKKIERLNMEEIELELEKTKKEYDERNVARHKAAEEFFRVSDKLCVLKAECDTSPALRNEISALESQFVVKLEYVDVMNKDVQEKALQYESLKSRHDALSHPDFHNLLLYSVPNPREYRDLSN